MKDGVFCHSLAEPGMCVNVCTFFAEMGSSTRTVGCSAQCADAQPDQNRAGKVRSFSCCIPHTHCQALPMHTLCDPCARGSASC